MSTEITARHAQINERLQQYAREQADTLCAEFPKVEHVHVILGFERRLYQAEFVVQVKGAQVVGVGEHGENVMTAIDEAMDKVTRQLRKQRDKQVEARHGN
ncbi:MAG: ribosome-associated translation inhibitor RaiA [Lentisphaerae bacterium]|nr:ribosome-associated translation inhibitor RaiA [Lentisphaerota bacterium]